MKGILILAIMAFGLIVTSQRLPGEMYISADGRVMYTGGQSPTGMYEKEIIREVHLDFPQATYWNLLTNNYASETEIPATLTMDGIVYDSVGVRFRGNTSYFTIGNSQKKSFAVSADFIHEDQKIMDFKKLKFNNAHEDPTLMREVLYCQMAARHTPIAKANYVHLFLNDQDWGLYPNIQSLDKTFLDGYFLSNDGGRFRATTEETGMGGGGGPGWGDGTAGFNFLGTDTSIYQEYYALKSSDIDNPWQKLVDAFQILSTATNDNKSAVSAKIDIDKALWFLAVENIFTDDDSYVMKGKMDYYIYYEPETDRTIPLEYDGNSSFQSNLATSNSWGPFKNVNNANYPLLNKLLNLPEWRQRYLAHYRTILNETFTTENANALIDSLDAQINVLVSNDTKKLYSTAQYTSGVPALKTFVANRRNFLLNNAEVGQVAPAIASAPFYNSELTEYKLPVDNEVTNIQATVSSASGVNKVNLYYATGLVGNFSVITMYDDGAHEDEAAGDGIFGAQIPGYDAGTLVRYYVEAIAENEALSVSYLPTGAEHDVFVYTVAESNVPNGVVINEILASNENGATDENGDHEDWIELYNTNDFEVDLSGFYLSDDITAPDQWQIPMGTVLPADSYLIVWADEDDEDGPFHASFKLSAGGETLIFSDQTLSVVDEVAFGAQTTDQGYARYPNGTGAFRIQEATYSASNNIQQVTSGVVVNEIVASNESGATDEAGDFEDWIELYNNNNFAVDLSGFYLSDDGGELNKWVFPEGTIIAANDYLIVWADDEAEEGPLHAAFKLSTGGEAVLFSDTTLFILDDVTFGAQTTDMGYARVPNGTGGFMIQSTTFNASNNIQQVTSGVVVNEILASNESGTTDEAGDFEDWIELYNNNDFAVDISGFYLSDNGTDPDKWTFPAGTIIDAKGYLIVWADDEAEEGPLHAAFKLSAGGEDVVFSDTLLIVLDSVDFGEQIVDMGFARIPNGTGDFVIQKPTFNDNNENATATSAIETDTEVMVYPNPFTDQLWIRVTTMHLPTSYWLTDQTGRIVKKGKLQDSNSLISALDLAPGLYYLRVGDNNSSMAKAIKL